MLFCNTWPFLYSADEWNGCGEFLTGDTRTLCYYDERFFLEFDRGIKWHVQNALAVFDSLFHLSDFSLLKWNYKLAMPVFTEGQYTIQNFAKVSTLLQKKIVKSSAHKIVVFIRAFVLLQISDFISFFA